MAKTPIIADSADEANIEDLENVNIPTEVQSDENTDNNEVNSELEGNSENDSDVENELEEANDEDKEPEDTENDSKDEEPKLDEEVLKLRKLYENMLDSKCKAQYCEAEIVAIILELMNSKRARFIKDYEVAKGKFNDGRAAVSKEVFDEAIAIDTLPYYKPVTHPEFQSASLGKQIFKVLRVYLKTFGIEDTGYSKQIND